MSLKPIEFSQGKITVLDQRLVPQQEVYVELKSIEDAHRSIADMIVRGAPLIGFVAIFGMSLWLKENEQKFSKDGWLKASSYLKSARPTAVNLAFEVDRVVQYVLDSQNFSFDMVVQYALGEIDKLAQHNLYMAQAGEKKLLELYGNRPLTLMTHCNTGILACGCRGTALGVIEYLHQNNRVNHVYADETRPYLQGSRLTAFELYKYGIPHHIVVEGAASYLMETQKIDAIFVGADRIAMNGDTANKVGTSTLAIVAKHYGVPFFVVAPTSSFDFSINSGKEIHIEMRSEEEITSFYGKKIAPKDSPALNPSFDVTSAELITGIICEKGLIEFPTIEKMKQVLC